MPIPISLSLSLSISFLSLRSSSVASVRGEIYAQGHSSEREGEARLGREASSAFYGQFQFPGAGFVQFTDVHMTSAMKGLGG